MTYAKIDFAVAALLVLVTGCTKHERTIEPLPASGKSVEESGRVASPNSQSTPQAESDKTWADMITMLNDAPISKTAIFYYFERTAIAMGERPTKFALYNLNLMEVVQKLPDGYLMHYESPMGGRDGADGEYAFLRTKADIRENHHFLDAAHWCMCEGTYSYTALDGFHREIYSFVMMPDRANAIVNARLGHRQ